ncbi:MAG: zinc-binding dehydrogenase [Myxococcota bacterium]
MSDGIRAMVQTAPGTLALRRFPRPRIGEDDALLRVEACGICGTDAEVFDGSIPLDAPVIPGHEPVGRIEAIGPRMAERWQIAVGDRVVVQSDFGCGRCSNCFEQRRCRVAPGVYGFMPIDASPSLWGGYAEMLYLAPGAVVHKIDRRIPARIAALYNPLGAGFAWAVEAPNLRLGQSIAIFGPGQRGLACVLAAKRAGAAKIFVTGLGSKDGAKLGLAKTLGADVVIDVEQEDAVRRIEAETNGDGVDVTVDTTPHATKPVVDAVWSTRPGGTIVLAGIKGRGRGVPDFPSDEVAMRFQTIRGVRAVDYRSFRQAIRLLESEDPLVPQLHTHHFPLEAAADAVRALTGASDRPAISITIEP